MKHQGYNDRLSESLGMKDGKESGKSQSLKSRRNESKGMEKSMGKKAYSSDSKMDGHPEHKLAHSLGHMHQGIAHAHGHKR